MVTIDDKNSSVIIDFKLSVNGLVIADVYLVEVKQKDWMP